MKAGVQQGESHVGHNEIDPDILITALSASDSFSGRAKIRTLNLDHSIWVPSQEPASERESGVH